MPQESGNVNNLREAIVPIRFAEGYRLDCIVDTGFDGALIVPASVADSLHLTPVGRLVFELVGGARMAADVALAEIDWLGQRRFVETILSVSDDALIGTEMFESGKLTIDYASRIVSISQDEES